MSFLSQDARGWSYSDSEKQSFLDASFNLSGREVDNGNIASQHDYSSVAQGAQQYWCVDDRIASANAESDSIGIDSVSRNSLFSEVTPRMSGIMDLSSGLQEQRRQSCGFVGAYECNIFNNELGMDEGHRMTIGWHPPQSMCPERVQQRDVQFFHPAETAMIQPNSLVEDRMLTFGEGSHNGGIAGQVYQDSEHNFQTSKQLADSQTRTEMPFKEHPKFGKPANLDVINKLKSYTRSIMNTAKQAIKKDDDKLIIQAHHRDGEVTLKKTPRQFSIFENGPECGGDCLSIFSSNSMEVQNDLSPQVIPASLFNNMKLFVRIPSMEEDTVDFPKLQDDSISSQHSAEGSGHVLSLETGTANTFSEDTMSGSAYSKTLSENFGFNTVIDYSLGRPSNMLNYNREYPRYSSEFTEGTRLMTSDSISLDLNGDNFVELCLSQDGYSLAKDKIRSHSMGDKFIDIIFSKLLYYKIFCKIIRSCYGNYVFQELSKRLRDDQAIHLMGLISKNCADLYELSQNKYATHCIQSLIDRVSTANPSPSRSLALTELINCVMQRADDYITGKVPYNVIVKILTCVEEPFILPLLDYVLSNIIRYGLSQIGCIIVKNMIGLGSSRKIALMERVVDNLYLFSEHRFGNYVVQKTIDECHRDPANCQAILNRIVESVIPKLPQYCLDKYASNIIELILKSTAGKMKSYFISEIVQCQNIREIIADQYGNYVIQVLIGTCSKKVKNYLETYVGLPKKGCYGRVALDSAQSAGESESVF